MSENDFQVFTAPLFVVDYATARIQNWNPSFIDLIDGLGESPNGYVFDDIFCFMHISGWRQFAETFFIDGGKYVLGVKSQLPDCTYYLYQASHLESEGGRYILFQMLNSSDFKLYLYKRNSVSVLAEADCDQDESCYRFVNLKDNLFFKLFQINPLWMVLYSLEEGVIIDANRACLNGLGYDYSDFVGRSLHEANFIPTPVESTTLSEELLRNNWVYRTDHTILDSKGNQLCGIFWGEIIEIAKGKFFLATFQDMTAYRRIQHELRESQHKFALAFKLNPSWMGICRMSDGVFVEVNDRFLRGVGLTEGEILGKSVFCLNLIPDLDGLAQVIQNIRESGNVTKDIFEIRSKIRGVRKGFLSLSKIEINHEDHFIINFDDRTIFIKLQEMLNDSEERYRGMFDNALAGFYRVSLDTGSIIDCNLYFADLVGFFSPDKASGHTFKELVVNKKTFNDFVKKLHETNSAIIEMPIKRLNGREIWVANYSRLFASKNYYEGIIVDITERKKMVELLAQNENRFRTLISNSNDIIFIIDNKGNCLYVSPSITNVLGYSVRARIRCIERIIADPSIDYFRSFLSNVCEADSEFLHADILFKHKNGILRTLSITASDLTSTPEIGGILINAYDITDKIKAQEEISLALLKEQELHRQKNHFISAVSHDFRTPLTNISLNIQLLERYIADGQVAMAAKNLVRLNNATKRLTALINEISLVGKEQSGRLKFSPEPIKSAVLFDGIVEQIDYLFQPNVQVVVAKGENVDLLVDKTLVVHIVDNILNNAIKFTPSKGTVKFSMKHSNGLFKLTVTDTGIGIPKDELRFLFDPYFRASNISNISGSGLGLSIVKRCIDLHKGKIVIKSAEGKGTRVNVIIPMKRL